MQITSTNFNHYRVTARDLLVPCTNLAVFEKIITDCYQRGGSLKKALSCYYSGNFSTGQQAEAAFSQTSYVQRIGYAVPSTRQDKAKKESTPMHEPVTFATWDVLREFPGKAAAKPLNIN